MPRHPPRALSSFNHHSITVTTLGWDPSGHSLYSLVNVPGSSRPLMLTKNRPDAGRLALGHQRSLSAGVAIRHYQKVSLYQFGVGCQ